MWLKAESKILMLCNSSGLDFLLGYGLSATVFIELDFKRRFLLYWKFKHVRPTSRNFQSTPRIWLSSQSLLAILAFSCKC